ncbi:uncharacterized protein K441DRAFT_565765, partial [Cenococcum geophilum 1.58]|uniref:uncharacterized protein n=1 Tax=Cenococcum geophilum 1.58 TaxID=794803 RepID=UPI00358F4A38
NTNSFANSSERREYVDYILKKELGPLYIGIPSLYKAFFKEVKVLKRQAPPFLRNIRKGEIYYTLRAASITSLKA